MNYVCRYATKYASRATPVTISLQKRVHARLKVGSGRPIQNVRLVLAPPMGFFFLRFVPLSDQKLFTCETEYEPENWHYESCCSHSRQCPHWQCVNCWYRPRAFRSWSTKPGNLVAQLTSHPRSQALLPRGREKSLGTRMFTSSLPRRRTRVIFGGKLPIWKTRYMYGSRENWSILTNFITNSSCHYKVRPS